MNHTVFGTLCGLCFLLAFSVCSALAQPAGVVVSVQPGAWSVQGTNKTPLVMKSPVNVGDTLLTDESGHLQIIFEDDSTISIGPGTEVAVKDFVFDQADRKPTFTSDVLKGFTRFVTGKVVEQNRAGFTVNTPQATVGIRGTTFAVNVSSEGVSTIIGLDVNAALPITVTNLKTGAVTAIETSGMAVDAGPAGNTSYQTPPGQFSQSGSAVGAKPGSVVATANTGGESAGRSSEIAGLAGPGADVPLSVAGVGVAPPTGQLYATGPANARFLSDSAGNTVEDTTNDWVDSGGLPNIPTPDHSGASGVYSGMIYQPGGVTGVGNFSFTAALSAGTGSITGTSLSILSGYGAGVTADQAGTAAVSGGAFSVPLSVTNDAGLGDLSVGNPGHMTGNFSGDNVSGQWDLQPDSFPVNPNFYSGGEGNFSGTKQ